MTQIILAVNQEEIKEPYVFSDGTKVYSLEEAMYYTYKNWKEIDFFTEKFALWVEHVLKQEKILEKLKEIQNMKDYGEKIQSFLTIIPYFDPLKLAAKVSEIDMWAKENEFNINKKTADTIVFSKPKKANEIYEKLLENKPAAEILNNLAVSYMEQSMYEEAEETFEKACAADPNNQEIILNYVKALLNTDNTPKAFRYLSKGESLGINSEIYYLYGLLALKTKNSTQAIDYFKKALELNQKDEYYFQLGKAYSAKRKYNDALEAIAQAGKTKEYFLNLSEVLALSKDFPKAIQVLESALEAGFVDTDILTYLASCHRQNYDLDKAVICVNKALELEPGNKPALLEDAKIKKSQGKLRDYQKIMDNILTEAKESYRANFIKKNFRHTSEEL